MPEPWDPVWVQASPPPKPIWICKLLGNTINVYSNIPWWRRILISIIFGIKWETPH